MMIAVRSPEVARFPTGAKLFWLHKRRNLNLIEEGTSTDRFFTW